MTKAKRYLKIGILSNPALKFRGWEQKIFEHIIKSENMEITCLIIDGRDSKTSFFKKLLSPIKNGDIFDDIIRRLVSKIESILFDKNIRTGEYRSELLERHFKNVPREYVHPLKKRYVDRFSERDCEKIKKYELDIILRHHFGIIKGPILSLAKFGIWSFHHADNKINRGGPPGFWEVYYRQPYTGVTLQKITEELDGGEIIEKGYYSTKATAHQNYKYILEESVIIIIDQLEKIARTHTLITSPSTIYSQKLYRTPKFYQALFYLLLLIKAGKFSLSKRLGRQWHLERDVWRIYLGKGDFYSSALWRAKEIVPPKGKFWADPFLFKHNGEVFCFFENYEYKRRKAKISVAKIKKNQFCDIVDAIVTDYHLSFPFVFSDGDKIFMLPESHSTLRIEVWQCIDFPARWTLCSTALEGKCVGDSVLFKDKGDQWWLFTNISRGPIRNHDNELHIFKVDGPLLNSVEPHPLNPVIRDSRRARNGGRIIYHNGDILRAAQKNISNIYGYGITIQKITKLSMEEYAEETHDEIGPNFDDKLLATHHYDTCDDIFVIDGCKKCR